MSGILIVMSGILGIFIVNAIFSLLGMTFLWEMEFQMQLLYVIFPLSILSILIMLTMAILLTRKRE
jgi:ABC-type antimicrobial peptide transport system permease subunit